MIFKKKVFLLIKMSSKEVISLGKTKRLIDLNKSYTNFKLTFNVVSENQEDFFLAVVDQKTLDEVADSDIEYKLANGSLSGSVVSDKNIYQNYFLILKSENPVNVNVEINIEELPKKINPPMPQNNGVNNPGRVKGVMPSLNKGFFDSLTTKQIVLIVGVIGVLVFLYFRYGKKSNEVAESVITSTELEVPRSSFVPSSHASSETSSIASSMRSSSKSVSSRASSSSASSRDEPLIERLKKLNLSKK